MHGYDPRLDGVIAGEHNDWNRTRRILHGRHHVSAEHNDHVGLQRRNLNRKTSESLRAAFGIPIFNGRAITAMAGLTPVGFTTTDSESATLHCKPWFLA